MPQGPLAAAVATQPLNTAYSSFKLAPMQMDFTGNLLTGQGSLNKLNITAATVVKAGPGRICRVFVNTAGSTVGTVSDVLTTGAVAAANLIFDIPNTVGAYTIDCPCLVGIVITPGTGQVLSVSYD